MDLSAITAAYSAVSSIKEISKGLLDAKIDTEVKAKVNEVLDKIGSIQDTLFYVREELHIKQNEAHRLAEKVRELETQLEAQSKVFYRKPSYWIRAGAGEDEYEDGPFCQSCFDVEKNLVRLQGGNNDRWRCNECKVGVLGKAYRPPPQKKRVHGGIKI
ncbi:MAG: hypothetical protein V7707_03150 [Motiliproteus sp.]